MRHPPSVLFRAATMLGCVALLVGVAGVFYFGSRTPTWRETLPVDAATVVVRGVGDGEGLRVEALWRDSDDAEHAEVGAPGSEPGFWYFREVPDGLPLKIRISRDDATVLHEQHAILSRGTGFEVLLRE